MSLMVTMYRLRIYKGIFCFILLFNLVIGKLCDKNNLSVLNCSETQFCNETNLCECRAGFTFYNDTYCIKQNHTSSHSNSTTPKNSSLVDTQGNGSVVAGVLIPLFLIIVVICGVYVSRKYKLISWMRNRFNQRNNTYDEFMIGQDPEDDDPPLR